MVFNLYDRVRIIDKDVIGTMVEIFESGGKRYYTVESNKPGYVNDPDAYPGEYPLYDCTEDRLSKV